MIYTVKENEIHQTTRRQTSVSQTKMVALFGVSDLLMSFGIKCRRWNKTYTKAELESTGWFILYTCNLFVIYTIKIIDHGQQPMKMYTEVALLYNVIYTVQENH